MSVYLKQKKNIVILCTALLSFGLKAQQKPLTHGSKTSELLQKKQTKGKEDLILMDENGKKVALSDLKGKVVFVNFWATWCSPCVEEMPTISTLKNKFKGNDHIVFIFLNVEADLTKSKKFMKDKNFDLPVYVAASTIPSKYYQGAIPTTLIFKKNGELEAQIQGARNFDRPEIFEALKALTEQ